MSRSTPPRTPGGVPPADDARLSTGDGPPSADDRWSVADEERLSVEEDAPEIAGRLKGLQKIVNKVRLYGAEHEQAIAESRRLLEQIGPLLDEIERLELTVTADSLDLGGLPIITDPDHAGLADNLYRDGIRQLVLRAGLTADELLQLLQILGTNFYLPQHEEDTLQSLLWTADLPHVEYESIRGIEEAIEDSEDAARGENLDFNEICQRILASPDLAAPGSPAPIGAADGDETRPMDPELPPEVEDGAGDGDGASSDAWLGGSGSSTRLASDGTSTLGALGRAAAIAGATTSRGERQLGSLDTIEFVEGQRENLDVPPEDLIALWDEADSMGYGTMLGRAVDTLVHHDLRPGEDLVEGAPLITTCLEHAADAGLAGPYRRALDALGLLVTHRAADDEIRVAQPLLRHLLDVQMLLRLMRSVGHDAPEDAAEIDGILSLGGAELGMLLLDEVAAIEPGPLRTYAIARVVTVLGDDPRPLLDNLRRLESSRLRIRLEALALMPSMAARDHMVAILDHADPQIRCAVVDLLPDDALLHLWKRLATMLAGDRDHRVRCAIMQRMESGGFPAIVQVLGKMITAESFHERDPGEKRLALEIFVRSAASSSVEVLSGLLHLKVGLMARRVAETRTLAALALGWLGTPEARVVLSRAARAWDPGLRRAGREGLDVLERRRS